MLLHGDGCKCTTHLELCLLTEQPRFCRALTQRSVRRWEYEQYVNEWACLCFNKIIYGHWNLNVLSFKCVMIYFFRHFKTAKIILNDRTYRHLSCWKDLPEGLLYRALRPAGRTQPLCGENVKLSYRQDTDLPAVLYLFERHKKNRLVNFGLLKKIITTIWKHI